MHGLFITATDTGAGKTFVTAAVARTLRRQGQAVRVCKPVATGAAWIDGRWRSEDTRLLAEAAEEADLDRVTPYVFPAPAAPPVAAREAGAMLTLEQLSAAVRAREAPDTMM